jgi:hypothetical protein
MLTFKPVTRVIRYEAFYLEKQWTPILNQLNIERYKRIMKIAIKKMRVKIEIQNKFYIWFNSEI